MLCLLVNHEPLNFQEANEKECWRGAMREEIQAFEKNNTWTLTELPPQHKVISVKWVYKIKRTADGSVDRYKARLVAKGYRQK